MFLDAVEAESRLVMITYAFAGLPVADYQTAYQWYVCVLGREADMFPHDTEAVWRLTPNGAICVIKDGERAGSGLLTLALDNLAEHESRLRDAAIAFTELAAGGAPRRIRVTDPDGNALTFFQDPAQAVS